MITAKEIKRYEKEGYDFEFVQRVYPKGNIDFPTKYVRGGDGCYAILHVYKLPKRLSIFWLMQLVENLNTICHIAIATADKQTTIRSLNTSMSEFSDRTENERTYTSRNDALSEFKNLEQLGLEITQGGEIMKEVHLRLFISADNLEKLDERVYDIQTKLRGLDYSASIYLFEEKAEWLSLFESYEENVETISGKQGIPVTALQIGGGYPFNHQSLIDPRGSYIGRTETDGAFVYDPFRVTDSRASFSSFGVGMMGYGKSTLLKLIEDSLIGRNTIIYGIEKNRDWYRLIDSQGGTIIDLSGTDGMLNPLEVFATRTDTTGLHIDELGSYQQHKSKLLAMVSFMNPDIRSVDKLAIGRIIDNFYVHFGLLPSNFQQKRNDIHITGRPSNEYPIMEQFYHFFENELTKNEYKTVTPMKRQALEDFKEVLQSMAFDNGNMFNGHTTIRDLGNEQVVFWDIDGISNYPDEIFKTQLFTALNMTWSQAMKNGRKQKYLLETKQINEEDVVFFKFFLDECQNVVNTQNLFAVQVIIDFLKEMRKFSAGIDFMTQSFQEVLLENASDEAVQKISQIFELCNTKIFLHTDDSVISKLKRIMGSGYSESDYDSIRSLKKRQAFFSFGNNESYVINVDPSAEQLERFAGGH
ncbi:MULTISPECIES: VirB4 family type IV secretion system protein [Vagococcus]|uniref:VirB4 family type IV secretion system protein n=1 Tax=Vagococcus TaxID=2737 RepID=UPI000E4DB676|nr:MULTISPECIES: ATPase [Vagococcus]RHH67515.1 ATPase [Vagococcus sp. AM17-17]